MTKAEIKRMIKRLNNAYVSCSECGTKWGVYSVGCSSMWQGICDVCGEAKVVTESRDYAYFYTGIHKLQQQLKELP
jgi:translation initiation factor 2 beta subunit (eIF-2beta)/eIF-5